MARWSVLVSSFPILFFSDLVLFEQSIATVVRSTKLVEDWILLSGGWHSVDSIHIAHCCSCDCSLSRHSMTFNDIQVLANGIGPNGGPQPHSHTARHCAEHDSMTIRVQRTTPCVLCAVDSGRDSLMYFCESASATLSTHRARGGANKSSKAMHTADVMNWYSHVS